MQLDRTESIVETLVGNVEKLRRVSEGNGAGIGRNPVPGATDDFIERQASELCREIPEGDVNRAERVEREFLDPVDLPDLAPEMLLEQGILADEDAP